MTANHASGTDAHMKAEDRMRRLPSEQSRSGRGHIAKTCKTKKKESLPQMLVFCRNFIRPDATEYFLKTWEPTLVAWASLVHLSMIPPHEPLTAERMAAAVRSIDRVIGGEYSPELPPRFGYVQLFNFLESLKSRIEEDIKRGVTATESCPINAAQAYEVYRGAQETPTGATRLRHLRHVGTCWKNAIHSSTLLLVIFSETAESFA